MPDGSVVRAGRELRSFVVVRAMTDLCRGGLGPRLWSWLECADLWRTQCVRRPVVEARDLLFIPGRAVPAGVSCWKSVGGGACRGSYGVEERQTGARTPVHSIWVGRIDRVDTETEDKERARRCWGPMACYR